MFFTLNQALKSLAGSHPMHLKATKTKPLLDKIENIVRKEENASYQHFLLIPQCFPKPSWGNESIDCMEMSEADRLSVHKARVHRWALSEMKDTKYVFCRAQRYHDILSDQWLSGKHVELVTGVDTRW